MLLHSKLLPRKEKKEKFFFHHHHTYLDVTINNKNKLNIF